MVTDKAVILGPTAGACSVADAVGSSGDAASSEKVLVVIRVVGAFG